MKRRTFAGWLVGMLVLLGFGGLAGCSLPVSLPTPASPTSSADNQGSTVPGSSDGPHSSPANDPSGGSASPPDNQSLGPVVASRTAADGGKTIHLDLYRIVRDGKLAHLTFTLRSTEEYQVGDLLSGGLTSRFENLVDAADGVTLVDPAHSKLYYVAGQGKYHCLCSMDLSGVFLKDDVPAVITASFATPPSDVTTIEVQIPHFGVFTRVPVG
jgi:hypothetical protein